MIDTEVTAAVLAVITVVAIAVGVEALLPYRMSEQFSELGVLGSNMKIADYPTELVAGENFTLYLYVGNHEGHVTYYRILVKLGDNTTQISQDEPSDAELLLTEEVILQDEGNWTAPITLSIDQPGLNQRLIFELWAYNPETHLFEYRFPCQLWLNVTAPT